MSIFLPFRDARYLTVAILLNALSVAAVHTPPPTLLLRVVLDDELFLDLSVDLGTGRQGVDQDAHLVRHHVQPRGHRSEEHTSELQSPCNLVCRLLLEKKKKK